MPGYNNFKLIDCQSTATGVSARATSTLTRRTAAGLCSRSSRPEGSPNFRQTSPDPDIRLGDSPGMFRL